MQVKASQFFEELIGEYEQNELLDDLTELVVTAAAEAERHKTNEGVEQDMMRGLRAVNSEYDPEDCALLGGVDIYMGITNLKIRAFESWVADILVNSEDKPWTLKPTPIPELPPEAEELILDQLELELEQIGFTGGLDQRIRDMKSIAQKHIDKMAGEATKNMETLIEDQLLQGGWRDVFDDFVRDLGTFPAAFIKGPIVGTQKKLSWNGSDLETSMENRYILKRVSPFDIFPSPNSTTPQDGTYVIERMKMNHDDLHSSIGIEGFSEIAIRNVIADNPNGWEWCAADDYMREDAELVDTDHQALDNRFDVLVYYGKVKGSILLDWGVDVVDPQKMYESEVWVSAGKTIRAIINPHPLGRRPIYATSFQKIPGSFWGKSLPNLLRDVQRVANASARSLVKNMAFSAGPIGEYDVNRLAAEEDITEVQPYRLFAVENDLAIGVNQAPAFRFQTIPSNAQELLGVYDRFSQQADDISGIPAYVLGNPQVAGAGRTLGGLSLLMGNAAKGIKKVITNIDKDVTEPLVQAYVTLNMLFHPDVTVKIDTEVVARGSSGLLQRELSQARAVEVLQMLTPYAQAGLVPPEGLQLVMRDILRSLGYNADDIIPNPQRQQELINALAQAGIAPQGAQQPSLSPGTPQPQLDGRSLPPASPDSASVLPANTGGSTEAL